MPQADRAQAYACDITYGTAKEFGFDFLRDRLLKRRISEGPARLVRRDARQGRQRHEEPVQGELHFVLVDEADSILIDEARTPLIISALPGEDEELEAEAYRWAAEDRAEFVEDEHYEYDHKDKTVELTLAGRQLVRELPKPDAMDRMPLFDDLRAHRAGDQGRPRDVPRSAVRGPRRRDRDRRRIHGPAGRRPQVAGRHSPGGRGQGRRRRSRSPPTQAARITVQDFFLRYDRLAGMTGTAVDQRRRTAQDLQAAACVPVPTNRPPIRQKLPTLVFGTADDKWQAIVEDVVEQHAAGPAGADRHAVDRQERACSSQLLTARGIEHQCSTPGTSPQEAEIVAAGRPAGQSDRRTNMAGRGTDIQLGEGVAELGGLHVICTEMHDSQRIDRQLIGRCGRQGDPGTYRQFLALDDEILETAFGPKKAEKLKQRASNSPAADRSAASSRSSTKPSARSNAATSATARFCSTTKKNGRRCSGRWARIRIWIRPAKRCTRSPRRLTCVTLNVAFIVVFLLGATGFASARCDIAGRPPLVGYE